MQNVSFCVPQNKLNQHFKNCSYHVVAANINVSVSELKCLEHSGSPDNWLSVKNRQTPPMSRNAPAKAGIMLTCVKRSEFNQDHPDG